MSHSHHHAHTHSHYGPHTLSQHRLPAQPSSHAQALTHLPMFIQSANTSTTHVAYARGFTAHDVDAAEALSALAFQQQQQTRLSGHEDAAMATSPGRQRAHTVSHASELQPPPPQPPPTSFSRFSAPAALPALSTYQDSFFGSESQSFGYMYGYSGFSGPLLSLSATHAPTPLNERHGMRRAPQQTPTPPPAAATATTEQAPTSTRRLVESPSGKPCPNCHATTSTLWRSCALLSGHHYLCNACGLRFKKGKYCPLCTRVYYDADTHAGTFKQCITCGNWTHKSCLVKAGELSEDTEAETSPFERASPYQCARCRNDEDRMHL